MVHDRFTFMSLAASMLVHVAVIAGAGGLLHFFHKPLPPALNIQSVEEAPDTRGLLPEIRVLGEVPQFSGQETPAQERTDDNDPAAVLEAAPKEIAAAPAEAAAQEKAMLRYQDMIKQRIEKFRNYPMRAKMANIQGQADMQFTILRSGTCRDIAVVRSSGSSLLDTEAVATIQRAVPFPAFPPEISSQNITIRVAIVFALK